MMQLEARYEEIVCQIRRYAEQGKAPPVPSKHEREYTDKSIVSFFQFGRKAEPGKLWLGAVVGFAEHSFKLGLIYIKGTDNWEGVPRDYVRGRMFVQLAADLGNEKAKKVLADLDKFMTREQIETSRALADRWNKWWAENPPIRRH